MSAYGQQRPFFLTTVDTGYVKAVFQFGKFVRSLPPGGPHVVIWPVEKTEEISTGTHQDEFPDEPQYIDRISEMPEEGMVKPIRILHANMQDAVYWVGLDDKIPNQPDQPLGSYRKVRFMNLDDDTKDAMTKSAVHAELTSEIPFVVEWKLNDSNPVAVEQFIANVIPEDGRTREEEVTKRMGDLVSHALQALTGTTTFGHTKHMMVPFGLYIKEQIEYLVGEKLRPNPDPGQKPWGIHIVNAYMKEPYPGHRVNAAMADAASAISRREQTIRDAEASAQATKTEADANKYATERAAEAKAFEEKMKGEGERDRLKAMAEAMSDPNARFLATLDVTEQALTAPGRTVYVDTRAAAIASVLGMAADQAEPSRILRP